MGRRTGSRKLTYLLFLLLFFVVGALVLRRFADPQLRALSLLVQFSNPKSHTFLTQFSNHQVREEDGSALTDQGSLRFRLYVPKDVSTPGGIVLVHGVHHLGIDDPRLQNLARALAAAGVLVMTPEIQDLADYRVTTQSIKTIGLSAVVLSARMKRTVGVIGLSFAGGLALLAVRDDDFAKHIGFVAAIGAHDDMARVSRFFATNTITEPDGREVRLQAHEYGVLVLAYAHLEDFFSAKDVPVAREALRQWLWEDPNAMKTAASLSPAGKAELDELLHHRDLLKGPLLDEIELHRDEMKTVSPHGQLANLSTQVFLLHGAGDTVIPATETEWLAHDVPHQRLSAVLVSPALVHVDMGDKVTLKQKWDLVQFLADLLKATDNLPKEIAIPHLERAGH